VQTFGDLVTFNPRIHALVADGAFLPSGTIRVLPPVPETALCDPLRPRCTTASAPQPTMLQVDNASPAT